MVSSHFKAVLKVIICQEEMQICPLALDDRYLSEENVTLCQSHMHPYTRCLLPRISSLLFLLDTGESWQHKGQTKPF